MSAPPDHARPRLRLAHLDGLRALAASYVVGFHAVLGFAPQELTGAWRVLKRAFAFGHEAVAVFIVLSGYCLMLPVVRNQSSGMRVELWRFVQRRARRILPPYYAALVSSLALLAAVPLLRVPSHTTWDDSLPGLAPGPVISHLLLVHNWSPAWGYQINGPFWSVASEWQIYFFFPLLLLPLWRRFGMAGALLGATLVSYAPLLFAPAASMVAIPWYLLLFTFGMAASAISHGSDALALRLRAAVPWRVLSLVAWVSCAALGLGAARLWFTWKPISDPLVGLATATLLIHLAARAGANERRGLLALLESRPLVAVGHFSYSLYLTHLPLLALGYFALAPLGWPQPLLSLVLLVAGFLVSLGAAYAFHLAVERRFMTSS